ncbi:MAG TPA: hypothetical protein VF786_13435 [Terriglobales bacterium]
MGHGEETHFYRSGAPEKAGIESNYAYSLALRRAPMGYCGRVEYAGARKIRTRNKIYYRVLHWPIWIWVFFLAPGPLTFRLFAHGFGVANLAWLGAVLLGTGIAGLHGSLPGVEPCPYILRFDEDKRNPLYRKVCYTFAWNAVLNFALLNVAALVIAAVTGVWYMKQIYEYAYFPLFVLILALGMAGLLPRVGKSTKGEGIERRYFYGSVWSVTLAQTLLLILWKELPQTHATNVAKLIVFAGTLSLMGTAAYRGALPRTRPIVPGEFMVAD